MADRHEAAIGVRASSRLRDFGDVHRRGRGPHILEIDAARIEREARGGNAGRRVEERDVYRLIGGARLANRARVGVSRARDECSE